MPRPAYISIAKQFANSATGNRLAPQLHLLIDLHVKPHFTAELRQHLHGTCGLVAEAEVKAFVDFASPQLCLKNFHRELLGRHQRKVSAEGEQQHSIKARTLQQPNLLRSWSDQLQF